jgi:hypothetical protein
VAYSFDVDWKHRILRCRFHGRVTDEDVKGFYLTAYKLAFHIQPRAGVVDTSAASSFEVSPEAIRERANSAPATPDPNFPRIVIAPSHETFGLARMFEIQGEAMHPNLHVVRTEREAWAILAVQNPRFEPLETE